MNEVKNMRKEIIGLEQTFEEQRIAHMAWWENSVRCIEELAASKAVMDAYKQLKETSTEEARMLLDQVEEEWYLLKEAELQATYMQGISDGLDMSRAKGLHRSAKGAVVCRRVS